jgi:hypothetical protein
MVFGRNCISLSSYLPDQDQRSQKRMKALAQLRDAVDEKVQTPQQVDHDERASQSSKDPLQAPKPKHSPNSVVQHCGSTISRSGKPNVELLLITGPGTQFIPFEDLLSPIPRNSLDRGANCIIRKLHMIRF